MRVHRKARRALPVTRMSNRCAVGAALAIGPSEAFSFFGSPVRRVIEFLKQFLDSGSEIGRNLYGIAENKMQPAAR